MPGRIGVEAQASVAEQVVAAGDDSIGPLRGVVRGVGKLRVDPRDDAVPAPRADDKSLCGAREMTGERRVGAVP